MFDLVVEMLDALGQHFLLVDRVVDVELVQVRIAKISVAILAQLAPANRATVST